MFYKIIELKLYDHLSILFFSFKLLIFKTKIYATSKSLCQSFSSEAEFKEFEPRH